MNYKRKKTSVGNGRSSTHGGYGRPKVSDHNLIASDVIERVPTNTAAQVITKVNKVITKVNDEIFARRDAAKPINRWWSPALKR